MAFMEGVLHQNKSIWDRCIATAFVQDMKSGELSPEDFREYMIQDSIYLKNYARVFGKAIYHAATLRDIQFYYSILGSVTDTESAVRLRYLERFGLTDEEVGTMEPLPENRRYIDFLLETAERGDDCEILMALLPCTLSYSYMFQKLAKEPESARSTYREFIMDYADDAYAESCRECCVFAERKCGALPGAEQSRLARIFERASFLELDFWNMMYNRRKE